MYDEFEAAKLNWPTWIELAPATTLLLTGSPAPRVAVRVPEPSVIVWSAVEAAEAEVPVRSPVPVVEVVIVAWTVPALAPERMSA